MDNDVIVETGDVEVCVETRTNVNGTERLNGYGSAAGSTDSEDVK